MDKHPKVLVVSHNCFSKTGSNGRTLGNFFADWPKYALAQFYISNEVPDFDVCDNYYRVSDIEALKAFYKGSKVGEIIKEGNLLNCDEHLAINTLYKKHKKRKALNYIARNLIWDSNRWRNEGFDKWVNDFKPDIVILQLGDYAFMLRIALKIAKEKKIPLLIYNSEDYYFKDKKKLSPLYNYYRYDYKRQVRKLISYATHSIYISDTLEQTYQKEFQHKSTVIMTSTSMTAVVDKKLNSPLVVTYLGNLGVGRHVPLIEVAETLHELDADIYLDVYGKAPSEEIEKVLQSCTGIRLKGFVSYDEVVGIMKSSDILVHAENFSEFYRWDLKHAFSTKIADILASGTCFFVYAPSILTCVKYLIEKNAACVVTDKKFLKESLKKLLKDKELRQAYVNNALKTANSNHNMKLNVEKFKNIIYDVAKKVSGT